jgi:hypothetical protein
MSKCSCECSNKENKPCCPKFNPEPWDKKQFSWNDKLFVKDHVICFLHMPINMGSKIIKNIKKIEAAKAATGEWFMITDHTSPWGCDIYIEAKTDVPNAKMVNISGDFLSRVFEGPYRNIRSWIKEMQEYVISKNKKMEKMYFYYTTCPKCAKFYGKNYVVLLAKVK